MTQEAAQEKLGNATDAVALFAGTVEGRLLCERLSAAGRAVRAFVATDYGGELVEGLPHIDVRVGRLDAREMEAAIADTAVVVDATHPYAAQASANIRKAAHDAGIPYVRLIRPSTYDGAVGVEGEGNDGIVAATVADAQEAAAFLVGTKGDVLLTTGSKDLPIYAAAEGLAARSWPRILPDAQTVQRCCELGFPEAHIICMQGPFGQDLNVALLRHANARWMVTKDTGRAGGFSEKIQAAAQAGARVVLIRRPVPSEEGLSLDEVARLLGLD